MKNYNFKPVEARDEAIEWIKKRAEYDKFNKVVIGISGGKDSAIAAALCCRALGKENVHGLLMPNGIQHDINDSIEVCEALGISYSTINIAPIYNAFLLQYTLFNSKVTPKTKGKNDKKISMTLDQMLANPWLFTDEYKAPSENAKGENSKNDKKIGMTLDQLLENPGRFTDDYKAPSENAKLNLVPRIRMTMLRLWGQSNHARVCGTGNFSEITVGYCTKDGDNRADFNPLARLTSIEVVKIGKTMSEIPQHIVEKEPNDGLSGVSDEIKIGRTYEEIHKYIRNIRGIPNEIWYDIRDKELANLHKRETIPAYEPSDNVMFDTLE